MKSPLPTGLPYTSVDPLSSTAVTGTSSFIALEMARVISGGQSLSWAAFGSLWTWEEWVQVSNISLSRLSYVGCAQKMRQEPEPMALALESGPPSCSVMDVYICFFLCGSYSIKIKSAPPENYNLNLFLLGSCNKGKRERDSSYTDANMAVYVPGTEPSTGCGLFHWILARTWWG